MTDDYAEAINLLEDRVCSAAAAVEGVLTDKEVAEELRRIADSLEARE